MNTTSHSLRFLTLVPLFLLLGCQTLGTSVLTAVSRGAGLAAEYAVRNQPKSRAAFALAERLGAFAALFTVPEGWALAGDAPSRVSLTPDYAGEIANGGVSIRTLAAPARM